MGKLREYMTVKEAAAYLGVAPNTLRNWSESGKLAVHRNPMNGYRLFKISDLERLVRQVEKSASKPQRRAK
jgi:excisionase family DNA binding protein